MVVEPVGRRYAALAPHLNERQRRLLLAAEASELGRGGISAVGRATGAARSTIQAGLRELQQPASPAGRARRPGAGRKKASERDPELAEALESLVAPDARGDPESPLRWTCKSTRELASALSRAGHPVSSWTVGQLLHQLGYSLQANVKTLEGAEHPDRDLQFRYINNQVRWHTARGEPVLSVDTKKKELIGQYKNGGREWRPQGDPEQVKTHDFIDPELGKAIPYGIYDLSRSRGWVSVGTDHDTAAFAVAAIRSWWEGEGERAYPDARRLLICADSGGSNGYQLRLWKMELAKLAEESRLAITVCHFPPGTSKWNKVEHRLFAAISTNWRGRPLTSHQVVLDLIGSTTTRTGLSVRAELDERPYPTGQKVADQDMARLKAHWLRPHRFHADWNYTLRAPDWRVQQLNLRLED